MFLHGQSWKVSRCQTVQKVLNFDKEWNFVEKFADFNMENFLSFHLENKKNTSYPILPLGRGGGLCVRWQWGEVWKFSNFFWKTLLCSLLCRLVGNCRTNDCSTFCTVLQNAKCWITRKNFPSEAKYFLFRRIRIKIKILLSLASLHLLIFSGIQLGGLSSD